MDDAALKVLIDGLEKCRGSFDSWLTIWTWVVVVGVALELVFAFHEHFEALALWKPGIVREHGKPSRVWFIFELFAIALVTIGIAGELRIEADLGNLETRIRDANGQRLVLLQRQAGTAKQSAENAAAAAGKANVAAGGAATKATTAMKSANTALTTSGNALRDAESVEKGLDSANKQILALGNRVMLLKLIKEADISALLSKFPNQKICERSVAPNDPYDEGAFFAGSIVAMLVERPSGRVWMHSCIPYNMPPLPRKVFKGAELVVADDSDESTQQAADELQTILKKALILDKYGRTLTKVSRRQLPDVPRDEIQVWVGEHP
ncbi:MAG: hypothetical protein ABI147_14420 [Acidobacteriaceae bacterium]